MTPHQDPAPSHSEDLQQEDALFPWLADDSMADFHEADCGGVFDGFSVSSDADPGL